jgi:thiol-disulfide isomerase/thioredoxin
MRTVLFALVVVLSAGVSQAEAPAKDAVPAHVIGDAAPPFMLKVINQQPGGPPVFDIRSYVGEDAQQPTRLIVMAFFATWCKPCRKELPALVELNTKYRDKGLRVLSIAIDREPEAIAQIPAILKENNVVHPVASDNLNIVARRYLGSDVKLPSLVLIGSDGKIVALHQGYGDEMQASLTGEIQQALGLVPAGKR